MALNNFITRISNRNKAQTSSLSRWARRNNCSSPRMNRLILWIVSVLTTTTSTIGVLVQSIRRQLFKQDRGRVPGKQSPNKSSKIAWTQRAISAIKIALLCWRLASIGAKRQLGSRIVSRINSSQYYLASILKTQASRIRLLRCRRITVSVISCINRRSVASRPQS